MRLSKRHNRKAGQGMVEFAIVIPILLVMIVGIFEAARALYVYQSVITASREAARLGSGAGEVSGTPTYLNCNAIRSRAIQLGRPGNVSASDVQISYDRGPGTPSLGNCPAAAGDIELGDRIIVQVTGTFQPGPAVPIFRFPPITFTSTTRRTILKDVDLSNFVPSAQLAFLPGEPVELE